MEEADFGTYQLSEQGFKDLASELDAYTIRDLLLEINSTVPDSSTVALTYLKENVPEALRGKEDKPSRSFSVGMMQEIGDGVVGPNSMVSLGAKASITSSNTSEDGGDRPGSGGSNNSRDSASNRRKSHSKMLPADTAGHDFSAKTNSGNCIICGKSAKGGFFGKTSVSCSKCGVVVHFKCARTSKIPTCAKSVRSVLPSS